MSAFMISTISVKNREKFQEYLARTQEVAARFGAELLARGKVERTLTGKDDGHGMVVIVRFPSLELIEAWFSSEDYRALVPLREEGAHMTMLSYEAMA